MQSRKPDRIFTIEEWTEATPIERMYIHLMQPEQFWLTDQEFIRLEALRQTWAVMCSKQSQWRRIKTLRQVLDVSERTIHKYMQDARFLFGDILKVDVDIELAILRDKYYALAERLELQGKYEEAARTTKMAEAVIEKIEARQPKQKRVFAAVIFTDNPKAITSRIEDVEHEEIDEPGDILELQAVAIPARDPEA